MKHWKGKLWFGLLMALAVLIFEQFSVQPVLYFGDVLTNEFQAKGAFYDPVKGHTGIDLGHDEGTPLSLSVPLRIVDITEQQQMGKCVYAEDAWGNILVFAHLSEIFVTEGEVVKADQIFAETGNTGSATTGPHLHFEVISMQAEAGYEIMTRTLGRFSGYNIDPIAYWVALP